MDNKTLQYDRYCSLIVYGSDLDGIDLSKLRIKFSIKRSDSLTPNIADIRVYNLDLETALQIRNRFDPSVMNKNRGRVLLQAGYQGNFGAIFNGNIKQIILGRESATDTFIDIIAGDGDRAYNFSVVNTTLAAGSTQADQINAVVTSMSQNGVTQGHIGEIQNAQLPRGKVMYGAAKDYAKSVASNTGTSVSIQNERLTYVKRTSFLPGQAIELTSNTGMIGTPNQTNIGVNVKCLLNPLIVIGGRIQINNASVQKLKIDLNIRDAKQIATSIPAPLTADGVYYVLAAEHSGDTRGVEWYTSLVTLNISVSSNPNNAVAVNFS